MIHKESVIYFEDLLCTNQLICYIFENPVLLTRLSLQLDRTWKDWITVMGYGATSSLEGNAMVAATVLTDMNKLTSDTIVAALTTL